MVGSFQGFKNKFGKIREGQMPAPKFVWSPGRMALPDFSAFIKVMASIS
jgi:hypothetical protein